MSLISIFWHEYIYVPLINALVYLYNGIAGENMVWAVVWFTVILRTLLLPFSIISERNKGRYERLADEIDGLEKQFHKDPIKKKEMIRALLRRHKISPWAKSLVFWLQVLVFVALYQVFLGGIKGKISIDMLYSFVEFPIVISTDFFGFDASMPSILWAGIVGAVLFAEIWWEGRHSHEIGARRNLYYMIFFPVSVFVGLTFLPMVKSIFVLTSVFYSDIVALCSGVFVSKKPD